MTIYEKPKRKFCDYQEAAEYFRDNGCVTLPLLHLMIYQHDGEEYKDPVWVCNEPNLAPQVLPIFDFPANMRGHFCNGILSEPVEDGMIYFYNDAFYIAVETPEGISIRKLNLIHNGAIAEACGQILFGNDGIVRDYALCRIAGLDENQCHKEEFYWMGYPIDTEAEDVSDLDTFNISKVQLIPVFYQESLKKAIEITKFEIEPIESCEFFISHDTLWRVIDSYENGYQIISDKEFYTLQRQLKS